MAKNDYAYAVARIRVRELSLLSSSFLEQLVSAADYETCLKLLREKGWGKKEEESAEEMLSLERKRIWDLMEELVEDTSVFHVFLYANDYHNLKAAIKELHHRNGFPNIYLDHGTIDPELIRKAVAENNFSALPEAMQSPAVEAYKALLHTHDGQLCDVILDRAALEAVYQAGKASGNEFLSLYGELTVASADLKIVYRALRTGKNTEFLERALVSCDTVDVSGLIQAAAGGMDAVGKYLESTPYKDGAEMLKTSPSAFEQWCDNLMMRRIRPQLHEPLGLGPLAAYILARENEIKSVRIILSGKRNGLPEESIRERVRETYV